MKYRIDMCSAFTFSKHTAKLPFILLAINLPANISVVRLLDFHNQSSKIIGQEVSIDDRL